MTRIQSRSQFSPGYYDRVFERIIIDKKGKGGRSGGPWRLLVDGEVVQVGKRKADLGAAQDKAIRRLARQEMPMRSRARRAVDHVFDSDTVFDAIEDAGDAVGDQVARLVEERLGALTDDQKVELVESVKEFVIGQMHQSSTNVYDGVAGYLEQLEKTGVDRYTDFQAIDWRPHLKLARKKRAKKKQASKMIPKKTSKKKSSKKRAKASNPKEVIFEGPHFVGYEHGRGMLIKPTKEGLAALKDGDYVNEYEALEYWTGNGWMWVWPEDIGALTDAPIMSMDAQFLDDGSTELYPGGAVYAHMNYAVEDPIATWTKGRGVVWDVYRGESEDNPSRNARGSQAIKNRVLR